MNVAFGAQFGDGFQQICQTFQRDVGRSRGDEMMRLTFHRWNWFEQIWVDTDRYQSHTVKRHFHVGVDVGDGVFTHHHNAW